MSKLVAPAPLAPYGELPVPRLTHDLMGLVKTGAVYSLGVVYQMGMPVPGIMPPYTLSPGLRHGDLDDLRPASAASETISMSAHTGTHIDALCHIGERQAARDNGSSSDEGPVMLFNGKGRTVPAASTANRLGQTHLSIADMPPIVTRGVLLDVAGYKGVEALPDSYWITAEDVEGTLARQSTQVTPGTAVLLRTGFYHHMLNGNKAFTDAIAGLGLDGAEWLVAQGMILAGSDTMPVEVLPPMDHRVHRFHLVHNGITHLENLCLEELAAKQVYEFLLIVAPLRILGATGSWVNPLAIA